ncbi:MAG: VWA domain-containing protein [Candidatus Eremiobacteraeota bacterium]|nr:VWA domain-containing protein [Candidatus Eremiobacteraeota bacterium]
MDKALLKKIHFSLIILISSLLLLPAGCVKKPAGAPGGGGPAYEGYSVLVRPSPSPASIAIAPPTPSPGGLTKPTKSPSIVAIRPSPKPTTFGGAVISTVTEQTFKTGAKHVDLVFCLDTSSSMEMLIAQAKQKLMDIAREIKGLKQKPTLRIALLSYGTPSYGSDSGWVRLESDFTTDLDTIYDKLANLRCNGGAEYVARVLHYSITELSWSTRKETLRTIFVAGNESVQQDPFISIPQVCEDAREKKVLINTIYCDTERGRFAAEWEETAKAGQGKFVALDFKAGTPVSFPTPIILSPLKVTFNATPVVSVTIPRLSRKPGTVPYPTLEPFNRKPVKKGALVAFEGQIMGVINKNSLLLQEAGSGGTQNRFFITSPSTKYTPSSWRPASGDKVLVYYDPQLPDKAKELEKAKGR